MHKKASSPESSRASKAQTSPPQSTFIRPGDVVDIEAVLKARNESLRKQGLKPPRLRIPPPKQNSSIDIKAMLMARRQSSKNEQLQRAPGSDEPAELTVKTVLDHIDQEKWDVDSLAAKLSDHQLGSLDAGSRFKILSYIADGMRVDAEDETTILRLLETTPEGQAKSFLALLKSNNAQTLDALEGAMHGDSYQKYHDILRQKFFESKKPKEALKNMESAKMLPWADTGIFEATYRVRFYYEKVYINENGKVYLKYWKNLAMFGKQEAEMELDPLEMIGVYFYRGETEMGAQSGETVFMPAVNFLRLHNKQFRGEVSLTVDFAMLISGSGLLQSASKIKRALGVLEVALAATDFTVNNLRNEIAASPQGQQFLRYWDTITTLMAVYSVARVAKEIPNVYRRLKELYVNLKKSKSLKPQAEKMLDNKMDEIFTLGEEGKERWRG